MTNKIRNRILWSLSFTVLSMFFAGLSIKAETINTAIQSTSSINEPTEQEIQVNKVIKLAQPVDSEEDSQSLSTSANFLTAPSPNLLTTSVNLPEVTGFTESTLAVDLAVNNSTTGKTLDGQETQPQLAHDLTTISMETAKQLTTQSEPSQALIAQTDNSTHLFRSTRSGPSYVGVGGNFGITGNSDLGGRSFAIISKLGLSDFWSVRPSVLFLRNFASFLIPLTYDFAPQQFLTPDLTIAPYLGGGVAVTTGSDNTFGPLLTAGVDIPISRNFTANIAANLAFLRTTDLGILVGIAYNF
jgi:hypothetical protein